MLNNLSLFPNRTCHVSMRMMTVAVFGVCDLTLVRDGLRIRIKEILVAAGEIRESRRRRRGSVAGLLVKAAVIVVVEEMHWWHAMCWRGRAARVRCVRLRVSMFRLFLGRVVPFLQCISYSIVEYGRPHWSSHLQSRFSVKDSTSTIISEIIINYVYRTVYSLPNDLDWNSIKLDMIFVFIAKCCINTKFEIVKVYLSNKSIER